ncbi:MAG: hypothetical protein IPO63_05085 [Bacteroidetes bacterium]|nr:hypothetical protein [Bacteroidota bacterium]
MQSNKLKEMVVVGASGLIGSKLMDLLVADVSSSQKFGYFLEKRSNGNKKVQCIITDFNHLDSIFLW